MRIPLFLLFIILNVLLHAQSPKGLSNYSMSCFLTSNKFSLLLTQSVEVVTDDNTVAIYITMSDVHTKTTTNIDTSIADAATLSPIYRSSFTTNHEYVLHYGKAEITGYYLDKRTGKKTVINEPTKESVIDGYFEEYMLTTLPLAKGFKKTFSLYEYKPGNQSNILKVSVDNVEDDAYKSKHFGDRNLWKISMTALSSDDKQRKYIYYIDKDTRKLWKAEVDNNGEKLFALNNEDDYNPYHNKFDKQATLKLVTDGKSAIQGQAFAREGNGSKITKINLSKKHLAQKGTTVQLIPYTDFFKEWFEVDDKGHKSGQWTGWAPMPKGAAECIKTTEVYDNEGHFEFANLMPGDYLLLANFITVNHLSHEEDTYSDVYFNGNYLHTEKTGIRFKDDGIGFGSASVRKIVTIKQDGEKVTVKLNQAQ